MGIVNAEGSDEVLIVPAGATFAASFVVNGQRRVVSLGTSSAAIQTNGMQLTSTMGDLRLPFSGATVEAPRWIG